MSSYGKLYLLPVPICDEPINKFIPEYNVKLINELKHFIAEDAKTARRFLKWFGYSKIESAEILLLNEHSLASDVTVLISALINGNDVGLMSDAGCPGIADPGADVIKLAHKKGIEVLPMVGPSAIVLSIMASGFNGQNFAFTGYLPIDKAQKIKRLKELEQLAIKYRQAQFFIETPYRNEQMFESIIETLMPQSILFIGKDITSNQQKLISKTIANWRKSEKPMLHKIPVVFGIYTETT
jgi:16S rRNA (cytidine1402-2'-O)-methyltransferase